MSGRNRLQRDEKDNATIVEINGQRNSKFDAQIQSILNDINTVDCNIAVIAQLHEQAVGAVGQAEIRNIYQRLDALQNETTELMNALRTTLVNLADETKRIGRSEGHSRTVKLSNCAKNLRSSAKKLSDIQKNAKIQYKRRRERENRITRQGTAGDGTQLPDERTAGTAFAQEFLPSRTFSQQTILQEVNARQEEMRKMEQSIEDMAKLMTDMLFLLEIEQEKLVIIAKNVDDAGRDLEQGGNEIRRRNGVLEGEREASCKWFWIVCLIFLVIMILVGIWVFLTTKN